nr:hypothetical protein CFP56_12720 [Quercus suber]
MAVNPGLVDPATNPDPAVNPDPKRLGVSVGVLIEDGGLTGALEEAGGRDGGEFTTTGDEVGTGVFLTVGDDAKALGAGACVGDFEI